MSCILSKLRNIPVFPRLLLVFYILFFLPMIIVFLVNQSLYTKEIEQNNMLVLSNIVKNANDKLTTYLQNHYDIISQFQFSEKEESIITDNAPHEVTDSIIQELKLLKNKLRDSSILFITDNRVFSSEDTSWNPQNYYIQNMESYKKSDLYTLTLKNSGYPVWLDSTEETNLLIRKTELKRNIDGYVSLSKQMKDSKSEKNGILLVLIHPKKLSALLKEYSDKQNGNTFIIGNNNLIIGSNNSRNAPSFPIYHKKIIENILYKNTGHFFINDENKTKLLTFKKTKTLPFGIVNLIYREKIYSNINRLYTITSIAFIVIMILGSFILYLVAQSISVPIHNLTKSMKNIAIGKYCFPKDKDVNDEIGLLSKEFNYLVTNTNKLINQVYLSEIRRQKAELATLQLQIKPHFLYNTLDIIRWQCLEDYNGISPSSEMVETFSRFLRQISNISSDRETLENSIDTAILYLDIMNFRYDNKIKLFYENEIDEDECFVPFLLIQPLIENSIKHGFNNEMQLKLITIKSSIKNGMFKIIYKDNGVGIPANKLEKLKTDIAKNTKSHPHIGLKNIYHRCQLLYGNEFYFNIRNATIGLIIELSFPAN
ncbi:two-component system, sensor histidine kinase YesM [Enterococcus sp. DIV0421]|uniref:cache domain-containing sensor histidine kinase n=1 Tax=Enterococcus sp. DIV0421 TaxID=2774688 RepID=UPI003F28B4B5